MRIAYASADHGIPVFGNKGASIHIQEMIKSFAELGHEVFLFAARIGDEIKPFPAEVLKIRDETPIASGKRNAVGPDDGRRAKEKRYMKIADGVQAAILAEHSNRPFDLVYERYSLWSAAGVRAARLLGIPCVLEVNAPLLIEQRKYRKLELESEAKAIEREVFNTADSIVTVSWEVADYVIQEGAAPDIVVVKPNGVNTEKFTPEGDVAKIDGIEDEQVIGFCGSLKPWHGLEDLLEAYVEVRRQAPNSKLLIVGDGPLGSWIEGFVAGAGLQKDVIRTGWRPYEELPALIRAMDVAVAPYPALEHFYFSPLKLFEYMACSKPVVASDIGQIPQIIKDGKNGLLNRPGDSEDLARQILKLLEQPVFAQKLGVRAKQSMAQFSWQNNARDAISIVWNQKSATGNRVKAT